MTETGRKLRTYCTPILTSRFCQKLPKSPGFLTDSVATLVSRQCNSSVFAILSDLIPTNTLRVVSFFTDN